MKISVVMATYNGAEYLAEQLESIRTQSIAPDEVIIVDDRSTDDTVAVANDYIRLYNLETGWKVFVNSENLGYANNFNKATLLATGDLLFFSDQDDTWDPDKIKIMKGIMEEHSDCMVLSTDYNPWYFDDSGKSAPKSVLDRMPNDGSLEEKKLTATSLYIGAIGCCMCVRRVFYDRIKDFWFYGWSQDDRMWKLSQCADGCMILHSNLIDHRIHANNTSTYGKYHTVAKRTKLFNEMLMAETEMLKFVESQPIPSPEKVRIIKQHIKMMKLRIALISKKHLLNCIPLIGYLKYYENKKSYVLEALMVFKKNSN